MDVKKLLLINTIISACFLSASTHATGFSGNGTPTEYLLTISHVEFHKVGDSASTYTTVASGSGAYDIAAVSAGANVGVLSATSTLTPGTYDKVRFTVSKTMSIKGASSGTLQNGKTCRTTSTPTIISNPFGDNSVNTVYLGVTDGGTPELEEVTVPTGSSVEATDDFTDLGTQFRGTLPISFTVTASAPKIKLSFNVTNAIQFVAYGANQCVVFPGPPTVSVTSS